MPAQIFNRIYNIIFFWRPKRKRISVIPASVLRQRKSIHHAEKNAADKVITFANKHYISIELIDVLFEAELKYETEKYRIQHEFPHLKDVLKEEIRRAREAKYSSLKQQLSEDVFTDYYESRKKSKSFS